MRTRSVAAYLFAGAAVTFVIHVLTSLGYGYQRDELYFYACSRALDWGYADQPPLIALLTALETHVFGTSLAMLRLFPALAAAGLVAVAGAFARRLGGGLYAVTLAMVAVALAPFDMAVGSLMTMNAFEPLFWTAAAWLVFAQLREERLGRWIALGAVVGFGALNKNSMLFYTLALVVGVAISPARRLLLRPGAALSAVLAAAIVAPDIAWQAANGWPQIAVLRHASTAKDVALAAPEFLLQQILMMNPLCAPLWIAGFWTFLTGPPERRAPALGWAYVALLLLYIPLHAKVYYVAPIYPASIAAGAVAIEAVLRNRRMAAYGLAAALALLGVAIAPSAAPVLPLDTFLAYQRVLDFRSVKLEQHGRGRVPQHFADMLGWPELVTTMERAVATLTPQERAGAAILTSDYGQAAALQFYASDRLPPVISGHNQYWFWGPHGDRATLVTVGISKATLERAYRDVVRIGTFVDGDLLPYSTNLPIYRCTQPRVPLTQFWPQLRRFI